MNLEITPYHKRSELLVLMLSVSAIVLGMIKFQLPGLDGTASDLREIPLLVALLYIRKPLYIIPLSAIGLIRPFESDAFYFGDVISHLTGLGVGWFLLQFIQKRQLKTYIKAALWATFVPIYYFFILIPLIILFYQWIDMLKANFADVYSQFSRSVLFEMIATAFVTGLHLAQTIVSKSLKMKNIELELHKEHLEKLVAERTEEIMFKNKNLEQKQDEILTQNEKITFQNQLLSDKQRQVQLQNEEIKSGIRYALTIQQAMLPVQTHIDEVFENFIIYLPKDIVSGDFFWFEKIDNKYLLLAADCTGHGVPGAFMSLIGMYLMHSVVNENRLSAPEKILTEMDTRLRFALKQEQNLNDDGIDVCICLIEKTTVGQRVTFAGAKRPLFYYTDNQIYTIRGDRKSIGGKSHSDRLEFTSHTIELKHGDCFYLSTDGFADQNAPSRKRIGSQRFSEILAEAAPLSAIEQNAYILNVLKTHRGTEDQRDDITVIGIKV